MGFLKQKPRGWLETNAWARQYINALQYNTSQVGSVVPLIFGTTRQNINLIGFGNYRGPKGKKGKGVGPLPITGTSHTGKGGGGKSKKAPPDYSIDVSFGVCEGSYDHGTVRFLGNSPVWASAGRAGFGHGLNLSGYNGDLGQAPNPVMAGLGQTVGYSGTAYCTGTPLDLGSSPVLPNASIAIAGIHATIDDGAQTSGDANPGLIVNTFLVDSQVGAGFPLDNLGPLTDYYNYCAASGLLMSPALTSQTEAQEWLSGLMRLTNTACVWSGYWLKFIPYADLPVSGNGVTWSPYLTPVYDFDDDDFLMHDTPSSGESIVEGEADPVLVTRTNPADAVNWMTIEYYDSSNQFNPTVLPVYDQQAIDYYGRRAGDNIPGHAFTNASAAQVAAQAILQRLQYVRNIYKFTVGWQYSVLEPMDLVTVTDSTLGLYKQGVRITSIEENENGDLTITGEEVPSLMGTVPGPSCMSSTGTDPFLWFSSAWATSGAGGFTAIPYSAKLDVLGGYHNFFEWRSSDGFMYTYPTTLGLYVNDKDIAMRTNIHFSGAGDGSTGVINVASVPLSVGGPYIMVSGTGNHMVSFIQENAGTFLWFWMIVMDPMGGGSVNVNGALRFRQPVTKIPYNRWYPTWNSDKGDDGKAMLMLGSYNLGGFSTGVLIMPSINDIIDESIFGGLASKTKNWVTQTKDGPEEHTFPIGPPTYQSYEVPQVWLSIISNASLSVNFASEGYGKNTYRHGFCLPAFAPGHPEGTNYYFYYNRYQVATELEGGSITNNEIYSIIGPANPLGFLLKTFIPGAGSFEDYLSADWTNFSQQAQSIYGVDLGKTDPSSGSGGYYLDPMGGQMPFTDEYMAIRSGTVDVTSDCYNAKPATVQTPFTGNGRGSGGYYVIFAMPGDGDLQYALETGSDDDEHHYMMVRLFQYNPTTEEFTQKLQMVCLVWTRAVDMPTLSTSGYEYPTITWDGRQLTIVSYYVNSGYVWSSVFGYTGVIK